MDGTWFWSTNARKAIGKTIDISAHRSGKLLSANVFGKWD